jgi:hypothetical protein
MKLYHWPVAVIILLTVLYIARDSRSSWPGTIEYRGKQFKTRKVYWTFEAYKDDPSNLDTNELGMIEEIISEAPFPKSFTSRKEFIQALNELKFPGYGLGGIGSRPQTDDGSTLYVWSVEIPQRNKERYLVARESRAYLTLIDDFVSSTATNDIRQVKLSSGKIYYYDGAGSVVREK